MLEQFEITPPKTRTYELENGNKLNLTITDPYGFVYFSLEHGQLPDHLKGAAFTSWYEAEIAAKKYMTARQASISELQYNDSKVKKAS